jgi:hypothetical protein
MVRCPLPGRGRRGLGRAQFSPGEIDGKFGENAKKALRAAATISPPVRARLTSFRP